MPEHYKSDVSIQLPPFNVRTCDLMCSGEKKVKTLFLQTLIFWTKKISTVFTKYILSERGILEPWCVKISWKEFSTDILL